MSNPNEEWRAVPGYEGLYEASTEGRIRSLDRIVTQLSSRGRPHVHGYKGRILSPGWHKGGYETINLYRDNQVWATVVHIVVARTYHGPPPPGHEVRHRDGSKTNNRPDNLLWSTHIDNERDKIKHGTFLYGLTCPATVLTEEAVLAIRARTGEPQKMLALEFGCTFSNISAIQLRKSWKHV